MRGASLCVGWQGPVRGAVTERPPNELNITALQDQRGARGGTAAGFTQDARPLLLEEGQQQCPLQQQRSSILGKPMDGFFITGISGGDSWVESEDGCATARSIPDELMMPVPGDSPGDSPGELSVDEFEGSSESSEDNPDDDEPVEEQICEENKRNPVSADASEC